MLKHEQVRRPEGRFIFHNEQGCRNALFYIFLGVFGDSHSAIQPTTERW